MKVSVTRTNCETVRIVDMGGLDPAVRMVDQHNVPPSAAHNLPWFHLKVSQTSSNIGSDDVVRRLDGFGNEHRVCARWGRDCDGQGASNVKIGSGKKSSSSSVSSKGLQAVQHSEYRSSVSMITLHSSGTLHLECVHLGIFASITSMTQYSYTHMVSKSF
jgi:hypothetical protein